MLESETDCPWPCPLNCWTNLAASVCNWIRGVLDHCHARIAGKKEWSSTSWTIEKITDLCGQQHLFSFQFQSCTAISGQLSGGGAILTVTISKASLAWTPNANKTKQTDEKRLPLSAVSSVFFERMKTTSPHHKQRSWGLQPCSRRFP